LAEGAGAAAGVVVMAAVERFADGLVAISRYTAAAIDWSAGMGYVAAMERQSGLLRDILSNPFRPTPTVPDAVLAYNNGAAPRLAGAIYAARRFEDLPVLADLLEEAGCCDPELLGHLRGPGPHVLGCHALDAVLGKV
jgi:hypothetical protein